MISIVISIYGTEHFLSQCLDSVIKQSYTDLEIICINDASPDNCQQILSYYAKRDSRFVIINNEHNIGVERTRYEGLSAAHGEYVMFIDSDDWLEGKDTLEIMCRKADEIDADYVEVSYQRVLDSHKWIKQRIQPRIIGKIEAPNLFNDYYKSFFGKNILSVHIWGKLYRRSSILSAMPKPLGIVMGEDQAFNMQIFPRLKCILILDLIGYNYRFGGMTTVYNPRLYSDLKVLYLWKLKLIDLFNYKQAAIYSYIEMKNILRSEICQRIHFGVGSSDEIKKWIGEELADEIWLTITESLAVPKYLDDYFVVALLNHDLDRLYDISKTKVSNSIWQYRAKQFCSWFFSHF